MTITSFQRFKIGTLDSLFAPLPGSGLIAAKLLIKRGCVDELLDEHGLASFTISMLKRGTTHRSCAQIAMELESMGAFVSEGAGADSCSLSLYCPTEVATDALKIFFEMLCEPLFDPMEHEINRQETLASLRMIEDDKFDYTYRQHQKVVFAGHGYGHSSIGEKDDVETITPESCRKWWNEIIRPENSLFAVIGDFDPQSWKSMLEDLINTWQQSLIATSIRPRTQQSPKIHTPSINPLTKPELHQGFIIGGCRGPLLTHPDYPALRLASAVLGEGFSGRLFTILSEQRSLAYSVGSRLSTAKLAGQQLVYIGTKPERIDEAYQGLIEQIEQVKQTPLQPEDLERAREYVIGGHLMGRQSLGQRLDGLLWWEDMAGDAALDAQWVSKLRQVTHAQLVEAARTWWKNFTFTILRPEDHNNEVVVNEVDGRLN